MGPIGIALPELLISFIVVIFGLAFPVAVLYLLFAIYQKVKNIEELLKKNDPRTQSEK